MLTHLFRELMYCAEKAKMDSAPEDTVKVPSVSRTLLFPTLFFLVIGACFFSELFENDPSLPTLAKHAVLLFFAPLLFANPDVPFVCLENTYATIARLPITHKRSCFSGVVSFKILPALLLVPIGVGFSVEKPACGILATLWVLSSIWAGHTVDICVLSLRKQSSKENLTKDSNQNFKSSEVPEMIIILIKVIFIVGFLVMGNEVFESQQLIYLMEEYSFLFPFSVTTIAEPGIASVLLLIGHILVIAGVYFLSMRRIMNKIAPAS
ncbi:MAG: hypothetical protein HXS44_01930 [Theionarchaea archaeon]|nr:hypothetical protein [Theionarchaea archaeon]